MWNNSEPRTDLEKGPNSWCCCSGYHRKTAGCIKRMGRNFLHRLGRWLLEIEMGFVWGVAGLSIIVFVFAAIWYIDPALLTLVLQFRQAQCKTIDAAFLVGISNCSWTSCRLGCTREIYQCWQIQVSYEFISGSTPYRPPWSSISSFPSDTNKQLLESATGQNLARLYPNVRGCGYPPELNCETFYERYGKSKNSTRPSTSPFSCWVSTIDSSIAMTELDLERAKEEVILSLVPLLIFIVFVIYAFCRLGVFAVCNPLKMCPKSVDDSVKVPKLTPKNLISYKRGMSLKKAALKEVAVSDEDQTNLQSKIPETIREDDPSDNQQIQTFAEVLPAQTSKNCDDVTDDVISSTENLDNDFEMYRRKVFTALGRDDDDSLDDYDTNTVINDLFNEELKAFEKNESVNLDDIGIEDFFEKKSGSANSRMKFGSPRLTKTTSFQGARKKSSLSSWDIFDADNSFDVKAQIRQSATASSISSHAGARRKLTKNSDSEFEF